MHKLLARQIKRYRGAIDDLPPEWQPFLAAIDEAYAQADVDRAMLERSLELSSQALLEKNRELRQAKPPRARRRPSRNSWRT
jgi:hypothetical protein